MLSSSISLPPTPPLFPYTTLFRSSPGQQRVVRAVEWRRGRRGRWGRWGSRRRRPERLRVVHGHGRRRRVRGAGTERLVHSRSEEHTSELQSHHDLVCRLLLEKKKI